MYSRGLPETIVLVSKRHEQEMFAQAIFMFWLEQFVTRSVAVWQIGHNTQPSVVEPMLFNSSHCSKSSI